MKRLWAAAAILAVLLGGTLWNAWYAERLTGGMIQQLKQAQERTAQGDWEGAAELSEQAFQSWQDHEAYLHILMRHSDTDEILSSFTGAVPGPGGDRPVHRRQRGADDPAGAFGRDGAALPGQYFLMGAGGSPCGARYFPSGKVPKGSLGDAAEANFVRQ